MAHDVFISHASKDKTISDAICAALEGAGIRCWIAPRDVQPGRSFAGEINRAIQNSKVMVLIFSAHSNNSEQVLREVQLAVNSHLHIIQFRIEEVRLNDDLEYFLSTPHWLDALTPPLENHLERLRTSIQALLEAPGEQAVATAAAPETQSATSVAHFARRQDVFTVDKAPHSPVNRGRKFAVAGAVLGLVAISVLGGWWFAVEQPRRDAERQRQLTERKEKEERDNEAARQQRLESERLAAAQRAKEEEAQKKADALKSVAGASKAQPYENSLGMKFVPVPITGGPTGGMPVLFSVWETRLRDFTQFIEESGRDMKKGWAADTVESDGKGDWNWKQAGGDWRDPHFPEGAKQTEDHPVVCVSWEDAVAFSEWLTGREHKAGRLPAEWRYRLPSDHEWSCAVGIGGEENASQTPEAKAGKIKKVYPWGKAWPPPRGAGNYCGEESRIGVTSGTSWSVIEGYRDRAPRTSVAGQYEANELGVYDLGGNVWEWCEDKYKAGETSRVLRGASWSWNFNFPDYLLASYRNYTAPTYRAGNYGFRVVVAGSSSDR